jgi:hypothetical protein
MILTVALWASEVADIAPSIVAAGVKAAVDAEIASRYAFFSLIAQLFIPVTAAWIAYNQYQLIRAMNHVVHNTNSIKDELVAVALGKGLAEGNLQGRSEQTAEIAQRQKKEGGLQ